MVKNKWFMLISILVVLSMLMVACGQAVEPEVEEPGVEEPVVEEPVVEEPAVEPMIVDVWFHSGKGEEREVLDAQVTAFNEMQDEIIINAVILPEGSYNDQVNAGALAGDLPCLLDFDGPFLYNYAWAG